MEFPRDVRNIIISKLDIDTRRSLGIFTRLDVPQSVKDGLSKVLAKVQYGKFFAHVKLGPIRRVSLFDASDCDHIYTLSRSFFYCYIARRKRATYSVQCVSTELNRFLDFFSECHIPSFDMFHDID